MFGYYSTLYTPVLALQAFCLYHAFRNNAPSKWYWLILFFPGIGGLIYLYEHFYSKKNISDFSEGLKGLFNSNYNVEKLEKEVKFSATVSNKLQLADAYTNKGRYDEAIALYESCKAGFYQSNSELLNKMVRVYFLKKDYIKTVELGNQLINTKTFNHSEEKVAYAWALHYTGQKNEAILRFSEMNLPFSNFHHRLEFARFYAETGDKAAAKKILDTLIVEYEAMDGYEKGLKRPIIQKVRQFMKQ